MVMLITACAGLVFNIIQILILNEDEMVPAPYEPPVDEIEEKPLENALNS